MAVRGSIAGRVEVECSAHPGPIAIGSVPTPGDRIASLADVAPLLDRLTGNRIDLIKTGLLLLPSDNADGLRNPIREYTPLLAELVARVTCEDTASRCTQRGWPKPKRHFRPE
jgi:hypothetical protein